MMHDLDRRREIKYNGIDVCKFIMSIFIVMLHTNFLLEISYNIHYMFQYAITRIGVPFFFIASGFLLYRKIDIRHVKLNMIHKYVIHLCRLYIIWTIIYMPIIVRDFINEGVGLFDGMVVFLHKFIIVGSYMHLWFLNALIVSSIIVTLLLSFKMNFKNMFFIAWIGYLIALLNGGYYCIFDYFVSKETMIYEVCKWFGKIFITARNGICFGTLFFLMGVYISQNYIKLEKKIDSRIIWVLLLLLVAEVMFGSFYGYNKESDVYILLVPLAYYVFLYVMNIKLTDSPIWEYLRKQSMYIFYIHPWFMCLIWFFFGPGKYSYIYIGHLGLFIFTLILSMIFGHVIIILRKKEKYWFLKYIT